jgi:hypothetical protein
MIKSQEFQGIGAENQKNIKDNLRKISSYHDICEKFSPGKNLYNLLNNEWVQILKD